jgi:hypothetical protein
VGGPCSKGASESGAGSLAVGRYELLVGVVQVRHEQSCRSGRIAGLQPVENLPVAGEVGLGQAGTRGKNPVDGKEPTVRGLPSSHGWRRNVLLTSDKNTHAKPRLAKRRVLK